MATVWLLERMFNNSN